MGKWDAIGGEQACAAGYGVRQTSAHFSHRFVARRVRGPWIRGARSSARGGILEQYVEHGGRAQRRRHGLIARRSRKGVRNAGRATAARRHRALRIRCERPVSAAAPEAPAQSPARRTIRLPSWPSRISTFAPPSSRNIDSPARNRNRSRVRSPIRRSTAPA